VGRPSDLSLFRPAMSVRSPVFGDRLARALSHERTRRAKVTTAGKEIDISVSVRHVFYPTEMARLTLHTYVAVT
jgi:hypothetical protein